MMNCNVCGKCSNGKQLCSYKCAMILWERTQPKTYQNARKVARMIGCESIGEVRFAAHLEDRKVEFEYEPDRLKYTPPVKTYTPDFKIKKRKRNGGYMYIEYKGHLRGVNRTTMILVKKQHPELDIRIVFENAKNKLSSKSNTTYGEWADKNGFQWAEGLPPDEWLKE